MRCPTCDYALVAGERRCPICGHPAGGSGPSQAPAVEPSKKSPATLLIVVGGAAVALVGVAVILVVSGGGEKPRPQPKLGVEAPIPVENPAPLTPAPVTAPVERRPEPTEKLLDAADEKLSRAKLLYDEGLTLASSKLLSEAGFSAEDAQRTYQVLVDLYSGFKKEEIKDKLTQTNQLLKLIHDAQKSATAARPPPAPAPVVPPPSPAPAPAPAEVKPAPAPAPAPAPTPEPAKPLSGPANAIQLFKEYVASPSSEKVEAGRVAALGSLEATREYRPLLSAIAAIFAEKDRHLWFGRSEERKAFEELFKKHDPADFGGLSVEKLEAVLTDLTAIKGLPKNEGEFVRLWGWAHVARMEMLGAPNATMKKWLPKLGLDDERVGSSWVYGTPAGLGINAFKDVTDLAEVEKALKKIKVSKDPEFATHAALAQLSMWDAIRDPKEKLAQMPAIEKLFRGARPQTRFSDLFRHVGVTLRDRAPCAGCQGTGQIDCKECEQGRRVEECRACKGTGKLEMFRGQQQACRACEGTGKMATGGRCRDCRGTGTVKCDKCDGKPWVAPALAELVKLSPCEMCAQRGFIFAPFYIACPECVGLGKAPTKP
ncbi:MAG TPA: hypothetical protein VI643_03545 [Planctomycetota bacterium]|nr:hypothetical protein [Planctomycetota bacterium]